MKRARGRAATRDRVRCAMGIRMGKSNVESGGSCVGMMATLGGGSVATIVDGSIVIIGDGSIATLGEGASPKVMRRGVAWKVLALAGEARWRLDANTFVGLAGRVCCGETSWGDRGWVGRVATCVASGLSTLGSPGAMRRGALRWGGASSCQDSKISLRLAMASSWERLVGGLAPAIAPATTCKPWMIVSSGDCKGTVIYECLNSTVSEMTWLLVSDLTSLKHR